MKKLIPVALLLFFVGLTAPVFAQAPAKSVPKQAATVRKLPEEEKINRLIQYVASLDGATFIRNGDEYKAKAAAEHLQMKRKKAGSKVKTAREFIEGIASESYLSGEPYQIRLKDGKTYSSKEILLKELARLEQLK